MANLQIKGIQDNLYAEIKRVAAEENRSVSQQPEPEGHIDSPFS